jgi:putative hydrolase of the HAD superfamily
MKFVVTFDAAGTLIQLTQPPGKTYADAAKGFGYDLDPERIQEGFRAAWKTLPVKAETIGPRPDDDRGWWFQLVTRTIAYAGYKIEPMKEYFDGLYRGYALPGVWALYPDAIDVLERLRGLGVRLGVVSNFDRRLYEVLDHLGIRSRFEHILISSEVGSDKPAPRIFLEAAYRFGVETDRVLHVGDDINLDGAGAEAAGLRALVIDHQNTRLEDIFDRLGRL